MRGKWLISQPAILVHYRILAMSGNVHFTTTFWAQFSEDQMRLRCSRSLRRRAPTSSTCDTTIGSWRTVSANVNRYSASATPRTVRCRRYLTMRRCMSARAAALSVFDSFPGWKRALNIVYALYTWNDEVNTTPCSASDSARARRQVRWFPSLKY